MWLSQNGNAPGLSLATARALWKRKIITRMEVAMQDEESQSDVNPGLVEQRMDEAPVEHGGASAGGVEREGMQDGEVERETLRNGPVAEPEREDDGSSR